MSVVQQQPKRILFFIDRIESSSYPVTETGYALTYRAFLRARETGGEVYVAYPDTHCTKPARGRGSSRIRVLAHRVLSFSDSPYRFYQSQRAAYQPGEHVGSPACHEESAGALLQLDTVDAIVWRQESGTPESSRALLRALQRAESDTVVYQSPRLALDPRFGSKALPGMVDPRFTPRTHYTAPPPRAGGLVDICEKARRAVAFVRHDLARPATVIAKPLHGDNGFGITVLGRDPRTGSVSTPVDDLDTWEELIVRYGDLVVQEYIASVRAPEGLSAEQLAQVRHDRRDFGEIRFLLLDGEIPRMSNGEPFRVARRVPVEGSLIADSGISHATSLSDAEIQFLSRLGALYRQWGIWFGGGDLIRTPDPSRPFVFTDAAQSVCGHAVVTGALNGDPYLVVDRILDSVERQIALRRARLDLSRPVAARAG